MLYDIISNGFNFLIDLCTPSQADPQRVPSNDSISFEDDAVCIINEPSNYDRVFWLPEPQQ